MNVVFDLGAVLLTWQPAQLLQQTFATQASSEAAARQLAHQVFSHPDWHAFDQGLMEADAVIERTASRLDLPLPAVHQLVHGIADRLTPIAGTLAILDGLRARRQAGDAGVSGLYYLSNMPLIYARYLQGHYEFLHWFDGGLFSADVRLIKPDPAFYHRLAAQYGLEPEQTVFIDDLKANVSAAQSLGWQGIHFESPPQLQQQLALLGL